MSSFEAPLRDYFLGRPDVAMAFVFGSHARGEAHANSDLDVAVYFTPPGPEVEWESTREYPAEREVRNAVEDIAEIDTDFIVLNRCPAVFADTVLREGRALAMRDVDLHTRFMLMVSDEAERFRHDAYEVWTMNEDAADAEADHRRRLVRAVQFIRSELADGDAFADMDAPTYEADSAARRNVERWIENLANASVDAAKTLLALHGIRIPQTYRHSMVALGRLDGLDAETAERLGEYTQLRNVLAHEYLDVKYAQIRGFLDTATPVYEAFVAFLKAEIQRSADQ
ncbi:hypothetical protein CMK11_13285 [Candidatus Poribacteria bacterium]|nr:hypothetical protein [Candidatus Poribacteria bacterium]